MKFLIVTGLSGAGKTSVLHHLEDSGYQCIDNLPPMLLSQVFSLFEIHFLKQYDVVFYPFFHQTAKAMTSPSSSSRRTRRP